MAGITRRTGIAVAAYIAVFICQFSGIIVFMAIHTTEGLKIARNRVTFYTLIPSVLVFPTENRKIPVIMLGKITRIPAWQGSMTSLTIGGELTALVIRLGGSQIIRFMTGHTGFGGVAKITAHVTPAAIIDHMPAGEREKQMVGSAGLPMPVGQCKVMTIKTIGGIPGLPVIGGVGGFILLQMAVDALVADPVETQVSF